MNPVAGVSYIFRNLKIEKGNKPTDWTPAPEDIQHQIDSAITNVDVEYYLSTSATSLEGGSWQTTAPAWEDGKYMWTRTKKTYADTTTDITDPTCITGATGKGIKSIVEQYYQSNSATTQSGGEWVDTSPAWENGKYVWTRSIITYTDDISITTNPVCVSGSKGDTGSQGIQGPKGEDGKTYYTWLKYADTPTSGMSDDPTGKAYIGLAYNKTTATESNVYSDYTWSKIKGEKGDQGVTGGKGADGKTYYTWIKYATSAAGANMSDDSAGKTYIGLAYNKTTATESTTASDYTWSLIKGDKGDTGAPGTGYTVLLSNESYSFAAGTSAAVAGSTDTNVNAWKNTTQVAATITKIGSTAVSGNPTGIATGFAGLTAQVTGNGTTACKIVFSATTALTTKSGNVDIAITVDGKSFAKQFSFSLALKGAQGDKGEQGEPTGIVVSATEPTSKYDGMLWKHTGTVSGLIKDATYRYNGTKWDLYYFSAANIDVENLSAISANLGTVTAGLIKNLENTVEFNVADGYISSSVKGAMPNYYENGKIGYPESNFSEGGVVSRLYPDKEHGALGWSDEVAVNGAGVFVNGVDLWGEINKLNRNLNAANFDLTVSTYYPATNIIVSGRTVQLHCSGLIVKDVPANAELAVGTLPEAYRPPYKVIKYVLGAGTADRLFRVSIDVDGKVTYAATTAAATGVGVNINETFVARSK